MREPVIILFIAVGGAVGAVSRYGASQWMYRALGTAFPVGTLVVNVLGCFLLGLLMHVGTATDLIPRPARVGLGVGLLGGLTTFSTFGWETVKLAEEAQWALAAANITANVLLGLGAAWLGIVTARALVGGA